MRALLLVNPRATSTTQSRREMITRALRSELDLEVVQTRYRGHASEVSQAAAEAGHGLVITLGGDGTVNEAINGILAGRQAAGAATDEDAPALAAIPGGHGNVFTRALGLPADPVDATGQILAGLASKRSRAVGLGLAGGRYFCFNAGLGFDAEVIRAMEGLRARGQTASEALYMWAAIHQFWGITNRREPAVTLDHAGASYHRLFCGWVANTAPWTYLGRRAVNMTPQAGFDTGLDVFAMRSFSTVTTLRTLRQMLSKRDTPPSGRHLVSLHDATAFTLHADRPMAFQVDGEYVGERDSVTFQAIPQALRVIV